MDTTSDRAVWVVVGALLGVVGAVLWQRLDRSPLPAANLSKTVSAKQRAASQRTARKLNSTRFRCAECDCTTTAGPLGGHHRTSGHRGRVKV